MDAIEVSNGTRAADCRRELAVADFDLVADHVSLVVYLPIGTGIMFKGKTPIASTERPFQFNYKSERAFLSRRVTLKSGLLQSRQM